MDKRRRRKKKEKNARAGVALLGGSCAAGAAFCAGAAAALAEFMALWFLFYMSLMQYNVYARILPPRGTSNAVTAASRTCI